MRVRSILAAAFCASMLLVSPVSGQTVVKKLEGDIKNTVGDVWAIWTSPFHAGHRDWLIAGASVGASAAVMPWDDNIDRWMLAHRNSSNWSVLKELREGGVAFTGKYVTPLAAGALVVALATDNRKIEDGIFGCVASWFSGSAARGYVIYPLIGRTRPSPDREAPAPPAEEGDQYDWTIPGGYGDWGVRSMPAGHAANIISCASFLGNRFEMGVAEPALYLLSAGIGVGRLVDRRHWTSDTVIGMIFGYAIGKEVAKRSGDRALLRAGAPAAGGSSLLSKAYLQPSGQGLTLGWKTTF